MQPVRHGYGEEHWVFSHGDENGEAINIGCWSVKTMGTRAWYVQDIAVDGSLRDVAGWHATCGWAVVQPDFDGGDKRNMVYKVWHDANTAWGTKNYQRDPTYGVTSSRRSGSDDPHR